MSLDAAYADFTAGKLESAETRLRGIPDPGDDANFLLARVLIARKSLAAAEAVLVPLARSGTHVKALRLLAIVQYDLTDFDASEASLERLMALRPIQATSAEFQQLAKLKRRAGKADEARAVMQRAMEAYPGNVELVAAHADFIDDRRAACVVLESYLATLGGAPSVEAAYILKRLVSYRGPLQRTADGLPAFGLSWEDTCHWPDQAGLENLRAMLFTLITGPNPPVGAVMDTAWTSIARKKWDAAENLLRHVRAGGARGTLADFSHFGAAFHDRLKAIDDPALERGLVPVHRLLELPTGHSSVLFVASDLGYFHRFTLPFLRSADAMGLTLDIQVHLLNGPPAAWQDALAALGGFSAIRVGVSAEDSGMEQGNPIYARHYYHAVRFVRFYQEIKRHGRPAWILDADVRILRDPRPAMESLQGFDLAMGSNPCAFEPILKIMACCVGLSPTPRGLAFAQRVAAYILHLKDAGTWGWGVDQTALFSTFAAMDAAGEAPATRFLDASAICLNAETSGAFQFPSGIAKYAS